MGRAVWRYQVVVEACASMRLCLCLLLGLAALQDGALVRAATDFSGETEFPSSAFSKYPDTKNVVPYQPVRRLPLLLRPLLLLLLRLLLLPLLLLLRVCCDCAANPLHRFVCTTAPGLFSVLSTV